MLIRMHMRTHGTQNMVKETSNTTNFQARFLYFYIGKQTYVLIVIKFSLLVRFFRWVKLNQRNNKT